LFGTKCNVKDSEEVGSQMYWEKADILKL